MGTRKKNVFSVLLGLAAAFLFVFFCGLISCDGGNDAGAGDGGSGLCEVTGPHWLTFLMMQSKDNGASWCRITNDYPFIGDQYGIATDRAGKWVIVGHSDPGGGGVIYSSDGGVTWNKSSYDFGDNILKRISYGGGKWMVRDYWGGIGISDGNMDTWRSPTTIPGGAQFYATAYNGISRWVGVGTGLPGTAFYSDDSGDTWTTATGTSATPLNCVSYANSRWVAVGDSGVIYYSDNGAVWTFVDPGGDTTKLNGVAYGGGRWVAVGEFGETRYSDNNGAAWTTNTLATTTFNAVDHDGNGHWLAVGLLGIAFRSTDGANWTEGNVDAVSMPPIESLGYGP